MNILDRAVQSAVDAYNKEVRPSLRESGKAIKLSETWPMDRSCRWQGKNDWIFQKQKIGRLHGLVAWKGMIFGLSPNDQVYSYYLDCSGENELDCSKIPTRRFFKYIVGS